MHASEPPRVGRGTLFSSAALLKHSLQLLPPLLNVKVSCEVVRKWITKNSAESENLNWILANTKPCPK